jgi:hypothetical protein
VNAELRQIVVVDAANVVGSRPDGWWRDRAGAARRLLTRLTAWADDRPDNDVVVVLEGAARRAMSGDDAPDVGPLRVVLAQGEGDDTIVSITKELRDSGAPVLVVTADRGLRQRVEPTGAETTGPSWLLDQLDALPKHPNQ